MKFNRMVLVLLTVCFVIGFSQQAFAQKYEFYAYGGGIFPGKYRDQFHFNRQAIWGGRFGVFTSDRFQIEGNVGCLNHFKFKDQDFPPGQDRKTRGILWDVNGSMNFFGSRGSVARFAPYLTLGVGGVTAIVRDENPALGGDKSAVILTQNHPEDGVVPTPTPTPTPVFPSPTALILDNGDTFFTFNYGGGLKGYKLWGPVGLRADFLGRTTPNFFGNALNWFEMTGGVTLSWGER